MSKRKKGEGLFTFNVGNFKLLAASHQLTRHRCPAGADAVLNLPDVWNLMEQRGVVADLGELSVPFVTSQGDVSCDCFFFLLSSLAFLKSGASGGSRGRTSAVASWNTLMTYILQ